MSTNSTNLPSLDIRVILPVTNIEVDTDNPENVQCHYLLSEKEYHFEGKELKITQPTKLTSDIKSKIYYRRY